MVLHIAAPCIEVDSVTSALEAMRQGRRLQPTHPFTQFISIHQANGNNMAGFPAVEARIFRYLAKLIRHQLVRHRRIHNLPQPRAEEITIRQDFGVGSVELQAWSTLYHRYYRVELDWSVERLADEVGEPERTLRRRQQLGYTRLTQKVTRRELHAREMERLLIMRGHLPTNRPQVFVGRDDLLKWAWQRLTGISPSTHHILLTGAPGIGKTATAYQLAISLIEERQIRSLVWLSSPSAIPSQLYEQIIAELGLPMVADARQCLRSYYQRIKGLVVLDSADLLVDDQWRLHSLLNVLEDARVIICARTTPQAVPPLAAFEIDDLDPPDVQAFFDQLAHIYPSRLPPEERLTTLHSQVGGNPGALWAAVDAHQPVVAVAQAQYTEEWQRCTDDQRCLWLLLALLSRDEVKLTTIGSLSDTDDLLASIDYLQRHHILRRPDKNNEKYLALASVARAFAELILITRDDAAVVSSLTRAIQLIWDVFPAPWTKASLAHFLDMLSRLRIIESTHLYMSKSLAELALELGIPEMWIRYYHTFGSQFSERESIVCLRMAGVAHARLAQWTEAAYALTEAIDRAGKLGSLDEQASAQTELALVLLQRGNASAANALLVHAGTHFERQRNLKNLQRVNFVLAQLDYKTGAELPEHDVRHLFAEAQSALINRNFERALDYCLQAKARLHQTEAVYPSLIALLGRIYFELDDWANAVDAMLWAIRAFELQQDLARCQRARINLALMYAQRGKMRSALGELHALPGWTWDA